MKTRVLLICTFVVLSGFLPQTFADNEFCNIQENLKIQEELIKDDVVLIEFLKVFPNSKLTRANSVDESNPEQTSMTWTAGVYSLDIHIFGFDNSYPSDCFVSGGYRLNAPHLPKMTGLDYHKDPKIVLEQIEELEPKYVKGGPATNVYENSEEMRMASEKVYEIEESMGGGSGTAIFNEYSIQISTIILGIILGTCSFVVLMIFWKKRT